MKIRFRLTLLLVALLTLVVSAQAAVPRRINYQGYLTNAEGAPQTGGVEMVFSLCDAESGGTCPWSETQNVLVDEGIFNVLLGAVTPLTLMFDAPYYLEVTVAGETLSPRKPLSAAGYALNAGRAESVVDGSITNAGISASAAIDVLKISGLGGLATKSEVASAEITDGTIVNSDLAPGAFTNITGVGTLSDLTVSGNVNLATTTGSVGIKTTSPRASLEVGGTDGLLVTGTANSGTVRALGAGVRLHWYPRKGAFRAGMAETSFWDDNGTSVTNMALYSVGMGYQPRATGTASTAIGAYNKATGDYALALGAYSQATASHAIAIGTQVYASGIYSIALGAGADTNGKDGAVVIGDDTYFQTAYASSDNQITMRFAGSSGGGSYVADNCGTGRAAYRFWSGYPDCTSGVYMMPMTSGWSNYSSRSRKENFRELNGEELLGKIRSMSITEWNYIGVPEIKYIGPVSEEFWEAFHLNADDQAGINSISIDGVNLAGVQALEKRTSEMKADFQAQIDLLKAEIEQLKAQLAAK